MIIHNVDDLSKIEGEGFCASPAGSATGRPLPAVRRAQLKPRRPPIEKFAPKSVLDTLSDTTD